MRGYVDWVLRHRAMVLLLMLAISALAGWKLTDAVIASDAKKLFFGENDAFKRYVERTRLFANDEQVIVGIRVDDPFSPATLKRLAQATETIADMGDIARVDSLANAQLVRGSAGLLKVDGVADLVVDDPEQSGVVRAAMLSDPLYRDLVVSADAHALLIVAELTLDVSRTAEGMPLLVAAIVDAVEAAGFPAADVHPAGMHAITAECVAIARQTLTSITPLVLGVLMLMVFLLFRRMWPVVVTGAVAVLGTLWTMGFAILIDPQINIMLSIVPAVILIISFSDVVHLCSAYVTLVGDGLDRDEAIRASGSEVGAACLLTSVTTFCGFAALMLVPTPVFQTLGLVLGFGVAIALLIALTLAPILFSLFQLPRPAPANARSTRWVDAIVDASMRLSTGRPRTVIAGFAVACVLCAVALTQLEVETRLIDRLDDDNRVATAQRFLETHFTGAQPVDLIVTAETEGALRDPAFIARLAALQLELGANPRIGPVRSYVDVLAHIHRELNRDDPSRGALPSTRPMVAQYLLLFEMAGGSGVERLIDPAATHARIALTFRESGFRAISRTATDIAATARARLGPGVQVDINSLTHLFGNWLGEILRGQLRGATASALVICLIMIIGLRSVRAGVWSMLPNLLPLFMLGGVVAVVYQPADSDVLTLAMIALGIGVDDTVHFLTRLRIECERTDDTAEAIRRTFRFAGRPIVLTTLILGLGFAPLAAANYFSLAVFGTLLPMTLVVALVADLLLVPALVEVGWLRFRR